MLKKQTAIKSTFWAGIEQYTTQGIQFLSSIVMARLLMPQDYGIIAMLFIFMDLSSMITDMGFTTALIRKQNCTSTDFSTVFYTNISISILLYGTFCVCAYPISQFYSQPILQQVIPITGITFILNAFFATSATKLTKELKFNTKAKIAISESTLSAICGITLAYMGYGIWALVIQIVLKSFLRLLLYCILAKWRPRLEFSFSSLRDLYNFGSKVLGANILFTIYQNIYSVIIGKFLSPTILGYFSRADGYSKLIPINISTVLMKVMLPLISKIQDDDSELININKKTIIVTSFIIFPASMILAGAAAPLISVMLTDKWLPCAPILQILCFATMIEHIAWINWDFILTKGYSSRVLKNRIAVCVFSIVALFLSINFNIMWVAIAKVISSIFTVGVSIWYLKKSIPTSFSSIIKDLIPMFITSTIIGLIIYTIFMHLQYTIINLLSVLSIAIIMYLTVSKFLFNEPLIMVLNIFKAK